MKVRYALWLPVALRLLFPFTVGESPISVMSALSAGLSEIQQIQTGTEEGDAVRTDHAAGIGAGGYVTSGQSVAAENRVSGQSVEKSSHNAYEDRTADRHFGKASIFLRIVLGGVWLIGFLSVGGYMLLSTYRFMRYLKKNRSVLPEGMLPEYFAQSLSARDIKVYQVQGLPSPCLVGGHIYVGGQAADDSQSLSHILAHEYSHVRHLDRLWAFLRSFITALYWFDPFVWAAAYAARQDSELACDEAAVELLGESERFVYGRTLLSLLESGNGREECPGMTFMLNRDENSVRERIGALAGCVRRKGAASVLALMTVLLLCGCAFTGAAQGDVEELTTILEVKDEAAVGQETVGQGNSGGENNDSAQTPDESAEEPGSATDQAAFEEALNYHGVMEGKDDGELFLNREVDYQTYFKFVRGEAENPMENGWYLLCRNEEAGISLYGLYTEEFGFRGLKTLIDDDVNTFDGKWCASLMNVSKNIRVLEWADDGLPRRFVWKLVAEESSTVEIWRLYSGYRYDTGTVDVKMLSEEECLAWAKEHLTFEIDQEAAKVSVTCDGDMDLGAVDISAYQDWETEGVQIVPDVTGFELDDPSAGLYSDMPYEGTAVNLVAGLKLKGVEGLWCDGLPVLTVQVAEDEKSASGFRLAHPRIDEDYEANAPWQEKALSEQKDDPAFALINPCPDYNRISDPYGERTHPVTGEVRRHDGVDFAADEGADILAAAAGTVHMTGYDAERGNYVVLRHEQSGRMTYYEHCKTVEVEMGQQVAQGEKIATVGQTGRATGSFLHFAVSSGTNWEEPCFLDLN